MSLKLSGPVAHIIVDFDNTLIRENLLIEWVLSILLESRISFKDRLGFLLKSICRGLLSILLSRYPCFSERAVRIACGTFRDVQITSLHDLMLKKQRWKKGYAINLNIELVAVLEKIMAEVRQLKSTEPRIVITSQGSFTSAIRLFLKRQDVLQQLTKAGIPVEPADEYSIIANRLEVSNNRFTGRLIPPVITKHNRLKSLPQNALFVGDGKDEAAIKRSGVSGVTFINYRKDSASRFMFY